MKFIRACQAVVAISTLIALSLILNTLEINAQGIGQAGAPIAQSQAPNITFFQLFGWAQPYVQAIVEGGITIFGLWLANKFKNNHTDNSLREALTTFAINRANALIAGGFVKMKESGDGFHVNDAALQNQIATASDSIPDALKWFGLSPEDVKKKIIDAIPQTAAGSVIAASSMVNNPAPAGTEEPRPSPSAITEEN